MSCLVKSKIKSSAKYWNISNGQKYLAKQSGGLIPRYRVMEDGGQMLS